jgi:hypothetical protein
MPWNSLLTMPSPSKGCPYFVPLMSNRAWPFRKKVPSCRDRTPPTVRHDSRLVQPSSSWHMTLVGLYQIKRQHPRRLQLHRHLLSGALKSCDPGAAVPTAKTGKYTIRRRHGVLCAIKALGSHVRVTGGSLGRTAGGCTLAAPSRTSDLAKSKHRPCPASRPGQTIWGPQGTINPSDESLV